MYYAMLIGASFLFGSQFMVTKAFEKNYGKTVRTSLSFSLLYSFFAEDAAKGDEWFFPD